MKKQLLFCLIIALLVNIKNAGAASYTWTGSNNTNWSTNANWSPSTGHPVAGDNVTIPATANMPTVDIASACASITISGITTITLSANLTISGALTINNNLSFAGISSATIGGATTFGYNKSMTVGANCTLIFPSGSSVVLGGNNTNFIINNGSLQFTGSAFTMGFQTYLTNNGSCSMASTTINSSGNNSTITNNGTLQLTSCTYSMAFQTNLINNGTCTINSSTMTLSGNNGTIANTATFNVTSTPITLSGQATAITNSGSAAIFRASACAITLGTNNVANITNSSNAFFLAYGGSSITINSYQGHISNTANFYAGISNSACVINLTAQSANITNSGTFYVGSTSGINLNTGINQSVTNNSFFIFQSDANGSAYIGPIQQFTPASQTAVFTGTYYVERYVTGGDVKYRGYRMFSSPVNAGTVNSNKVISLNYLQSSILVLGTTGTAGGFDNTGNPTIYLYRENLSPLYTTYLNSNWQGINNISHGTTYGTNDVVAANQSINIPVGNGYLVFFRGDRTAASMAVETTPGYVPVTVTLTAIGAINAGTIIVKNWYTPGSPNLGYTTTNTPAVRGFNCVGNPYPCSIDWDTFSNTSSTAPIYGPNVSKTISFLNTNGSYGTYTAGSGGAGSTNSATHIIPSGVGFFVQAMGSSSPSPALTFTESAKIANQVTGASLFMGKPVGNINAQYLRLQMAKDSFYNEDIVISFNKNAKTTFDPNEDACYRLGTCKVNLNSISDDNVALAVNQIPLPPKSHRVALNIGAAMDSTYTLNMKQLVGVPRLYDIWLMDAYKKDSLDMRKNATYSFNVLKSDTNTYGSKRFSLIIRQNPAYAYRLLNFTATKTAGKQVQLVWSTENEENYTYFTVERSTDGGKTFEILGGPSATGAGTYSLLDKNPSDQNLYRLKQVDVNDSITYSKIIPIGYSNLSNSLAKSNIGLYPNPASTIINITVPSTTSVVDTYQVTITNSSGMIIKNFVSAQATWQTNVSDLMPGTYLVKVINKTDNSYVGNTKFVKQ